MKPNPVLKKLGFAETDRVVIIHADDVGMCHASISAFADLVEFRLVSSGAVMVPCSWFPTVAAFCRRNPGVDMGVHLTLTSEWQTYRWGPISTRDAESGMMDSDGYFHNTSEEVHQNAEPEAVSLETEAQLQRALSAGIDVTHVDTHMGSVAHTKFIPAYVQLAVSHQLPPMIPRLDIEGYQAVGMDLAVAEAAVQMVSMLEEQGVPFLDNLVGLDLDQPYDRLGQAKKAFAGLPPGLTHFIIHPAKDTPEFRAITPDWLCRVADYEIFKRDELREFIKDQGIHVIGYRDIRSLMRGGPSEKEQ